MIKLLNNDICADCGSLDSSWVSINRGVLLCDGCCSIHLSLGRHISQIKSLKKGSWNPHQLLMVQQLINSNANNVWEFSLNDQAFIKANKKKPSSKDPIHPTKADFIRAKYQFLAYLNKSKETDSFTLEELSKQLHSSVRTANLETSLRLLALGADPNFLHPEKRNTSLHIASFSNQIFQVELLLVYGADPGIFDHMGKIPLDLAQSNGHNELADRLIECQYELTDGLAFYLCSRKPDHKSGQHFLIPEVSDGLDASELAKAARKKLQTLSNHLFEELIMDVYDEVDRRENETNWLLSQAQNSTLLSSERQIVPFLPANPEFSATRNQGRQKLAKFNKREFATLIIDILNDAKRRYTGVLCSLDSTAIKFSNEKAKVTDLNAFNSNSSLNVDPIYDQVYFDEDYASIPDNINTETEKNEINTVSMIEFVSLKQMLIDSQIKYNNISAELSKSQSYCQILKEENNLLNSKLEKLNVDYRMLKCLHNKEVSANDLDLQIPGLEMPYPRWTVFDRSDIHKHILPKNLCIGKETLSEISDSTLTNTDDISTICNNLNLNKIAYSISSSDCQPRMPTQDEVVKKTEKITRALQELFQSAQDNKIDYFTSCADRIYLAVSEMTLIFPTSLTTGSRLEALQLLNDGAEQVKEQCYQTSPDVRTHTQRVIQTAYDIAKAAKQLVMTFE